jgi:hypothetical protein
MMNGVEPVLIQISVANVNKVIGGRLVEHDGVANMFEALLEVGAIQAVSE